jgi:hypothetical protein
VRVKIKGPGGRNGGLSDDDDEWGDVYEDRGNDSDQENQNEGGCVKMEDICCNRGFIL